MPSLLATINAATTFEFRGQKIHINSKTGQFVTTLSNGRVLKSSSLSALRIKIVNTLPNEGPAVRAFHYGRHMGKPHPVQIVSVVTKNKTLYLKSKLGILYSTLVADTPSNRAVLNSILAYDRETDRLMNRRRRELAALQNKLTHITPENFKAVVPTT